jgi:hypothetical protein
MDIKNRQFLHQHYIVGYGSLLSHDSRLTHSDIDEQVYPLSLSGWQRAWVTRSEDERQTYVGATRHSGTSMNGALVPTHEITPELEKRESDYRFTALSLDEILFVGCSNEEERMIKQQLKNKSVWICETLKIDKADNAYPINQSYVDTCLAGCLEIGGEDFAQQFVTQTKGWDYSWVNDRQEKKYPRYARVSPDEQLAIDNVLKTVSHHRLDAR